MGLTRRTWIGAALAGTALPTFLPNRAMAQAYPSRDFTMVCPFPPGAGADIRVRFFADKLRALTGRTVVVDNKPGANGSIATTLVARGRADGAMLYPFSCPTVAATNSLFREPPVDVGKTIAVAATLSRQPFVVTVDAKSPYATVADLTAAMKKKGGNGTYATTANPGVIMGALYKQATGVEAVDVPYRNAPDSINEMASGKLDFAFHDAVFGLSQAREGRQRILAVSTKERMSMLPDVPTMTESGAPMDLNIWWGVMVQAQTPKPIQETINGWFREILAQEDTRSFLTLGGSEPLIRSVDEGQAMFLAAIPEWEAYVKLAKIPQT